MASRFASTRSGKVGSSRTRAGTFTATGMLKPSSSQRRQSVAAISSASSVSGSARPVRSASGTKVVGSTGPTTGSVQRASASTPTTRLGRQVELRLVVHRDRADVDRALERRDEDEPARRLVLDVGREELAARLRALGAVHRGLGALEEEVGVVRVRGRAGDADGGVDAQRRARHVEAGG